jgi:hypothetical protein
MRNHKIAGVFLPVLAMAWLAVGASASSAVASPEWHFNGTLLPYTTQETVTAEATEASLTVPGLTTTCKPFVFKMKSKTCSEVPGSGKWKACR